MYKKVAIAALAVLVIALVAMSVALAANAPVLALIFLLVAFGVECLALWWLFQPPRGY